ncbi:serine/threonine-protein kinase haspin [Colius striatus]|uniref:serine/threonine-protein kinase haspin n=1 Tax=Colius striatus TaxID=57412 RepID=UPI002B1E7AE4|nr:serine/threonine-protein kinase haspin [Colius striatus]
MPLQPRLLRTYSRRGGHLRPLPPPDRWISPPQDRKRFFSSTSAGSSITSAGSSAFSAHSDDPDFSPPGKRRRQPPAKRPARPRRVRARRGGGAGKEREKKEQEKKEQEKEEQEKENRPPAAASPSAAPAPRAAGRHRQGPLYAARRPLLCSTPQCPPARPRPRRRRGSAPELCSPCPASPPRLCSPCPASPPELCSPCPSSPPELCSLSPLLGCPQLYTPPRPASWGSALSSPASSPEHAAWQPPLPTAEGAGAARLRPNGSGRRKERSPALLKAGRVLRASVRGGRGAQAALSPHAAPAAPRAALAPVNGEAQPCVRELRRDAPKASLCGQRGKTKTMTLTPQVVLDPHEVSVLLSRMKLNKKAEPEPVCQQPGSPPRLQRLNHNRTKVVAGEGSTCRKACISGFSASRWGRQIRLRPIRHKNKRQQQPANSFVKPQRRQKGMKKGILELSGGVRDNDYSLLNSFCSWGRVRASLSFHKKKKVTAEESFCNSILSVPSLKSQLSGHQGTLSAGKAQGDIWSASSLILLAPSHSSSVLELMLTDAEKVFGECQQEGPITFEECIPLDKMKDCKKIGEGVFGEVFQIDSERGPVALKIIPIEGTERVNGEAQKSFGEILPEVIISKELSLLSEESVNRTVGFISLYSVHCVQGAYPKYLLEAWDKYHKDTGSENDRPDLFGDKQLFMVLEFEFGGKDLENMRKRLASVASAKSILHQVTASLAVAEEELNFEHRDLHWGNVLVKETNVKELNYVLNGVTYTIPTAGIHVNIIDYTLSRLEKDGLTVFCDLSTDEELFQGTGDYQFDIYREMKAENSNSWTDYHPHSNVLWLHYLSKKLLKDMVYMKKESTAAMKKIKQQLLKFHREVLAFESASDTLQNSSLFQ